jgi:hypothetical protein
VGRHLGRADPGVDGADCDDRGRREEHRAGQEPGHVTVGERRRHGVAGETAPGHHRGDGGQRAQADRELSGAILGELHQTLAAAAAGLDPSWDERFVATRRLIAGEPALLAYVEHYRAGVERQVTECLAGKLGLDPEDLRLQVLAELATTAFSVSGRHWVRHGGRGGRKALLDRLDGAVRAIPASLDLSARLYALGYGARASASAMICRSAAA